MKLTFAITLLLFSNLALSSSCWTRHVDMSSEERIKQVVAESDVILSAEVEFLVKSVLQEKDNKETILDITISLINVNDFKGTIASKIKVFGNRSKYCSCSYNFTPGVTYIIFAKNTKDGLFLQSCDMINTLNSSVYKDVVKAIKVAD